MFTQGQIFYFTPFYFKNGNSSKNKFFIVLKNSETNVIVASLPTSVNNAPSLIDKLFGCINHEDRCFNCYSFEPNKIITDNGFAFSKPTFLYGNEVDIYQIDMLESVYQIENIDYEIIGMLTPQAYQEIYSCLKNSNSIKRGIKKLL